MMRAELTNSEFDANVMVNFPPSRDFKTVLFGRLAL